MYVFVRNELFFGQRRSNSWWKIEIHQILSLRNLRICWRMIDSHSLVVCVKNCQIQEPLSDFHHLEDWNCRYLITSMSCDKCDTTLMYNYRPFLSQYRHHLEESTNRNLQIKNGQETLGCYYSSSCDDYIWKLNSDNI